VVSRVAEVEVEELGPWIEDAVFTYISNHARLLSYESNFCCFTLNDYTKIGVYSIMNILKYHESHCLSNLRK
jgi:hypothetical protein